MATEERQTETAQGGPTRRLFFALWPDEAMREAMVQATHEAARASGGRPVPAQNLHITLAFLGSVSEGQLPRLAQIGRGAVETFRPAFTSGFARRPRSRDSMGPDPISALEVAFDHLDYWRAAHVLCALPAEPPARMAALAIRLQALLTESGFAPDLESSWSVGADTTRPFRPHVTLARKVFRSPRAIDMQPVTWRFTDFVLVDSKTLPEGAVYTVLEKFALDQ